MVKVSAGPFETVGLTPELSDVLLDAGWVGIKQEEARGAARIVRQVFGYIVFE